MPRQLGPGGTQLPRHMGPPGPKMGGGGDPHACDTGISIVLRKPWIHAWFFLRNLEIALIFYNPINSRIS